MAVVVAFRSAEWDTPWWVSPNRGRGRFHTSRSAPTQYWCLHPFGVFAERLRVLGPDVVADLDTIRWRVWAAKIELDGVETIDFETAADAGIDPADLVADDWDRCQRFADVRRTAGTPGLIVPSAALPGTSNVVLFEPRLSSPYAAHAINPLVDVPTAHVAEESVPPREMVPLVRWRGSPHAALDAWRSGSMFSVIDPPAPRV
jgi:hypothetical protein